MDKEMRELLDVLGKAIVPPGKRKAVWRTNWHTPYYSANRYNRVASTRSNDYEANKSN